MSVDYASKSYWESRLAAERQSGFEWLVPSTTLLPLFNDLLQPILDEHTSQKSPLRLLHFGCGSSTLGTDIQHFFRESVKVFDCDFASDSLQGTDNLDDGSTNASKDRKVPLLQVNVLDRRELEETMPSGGWDILVDKSTADAVSCGPPVLINPCSASAIQEREAIEELCNNLHGVCSPRSRWICISYSSSRFDFLSQSSHHKWQVLEKRPVAMSPEVTTAGEGGVVYRPQTGVWVWVLGPTKS